MNRKKLEGYKLTPSIHTTQIKTNAVDTSETTKNTLFCINDISKKTNGDIKVIINANEFCGDLFSYEDFVGVFKFILNDMSIDDETYSIVRADMRFDSYDEEDYRKYQKLNRYLISMLALAYKVKNTYRTDDLFSQQQISVAIKNSDFEIENYDREKKNEITGNTSEKAKSRLEERSKRHNTSNIWTVETLEKIFCKEWFKRWDKAINYRDEVHRKYNDNLVEIYFRDKDKRPVVFSSVNEFLKRYQDCIFTKGQMIDLLTRIGVKNPETAAKNYKTRYGCEFFSKSDVLYAIDQIKKATTEYFNSNQKN